MRLLLDTHTMLWALLNNPQLSTTAASLITDPDSTILLSPASPSGIAIKASVGKYRPSTGFFPNLSRQIEQGVFSPLPITLAQIEVIESLPYHHKDPFDRMLIAQAMVEQVPIVSVDAAFDAYPVARLW